VFAAGDVAEHNGQVLGLWPVAVKQAEVAAVDALGGDQRMTADLRTTIVKGIGLELASVGQQEPGPEGEIIVAEDPSAPSYRRLVLAAYRVVGATVLGHHPLDLAAATMAVKQVSFSTQLAAPPRRQATGRCSARSDSMPTRCPRPGEVCAEPAFGVQSFTRLLRSNRAVEGVGSQAPRSNWGGETPRSPERSSSARWAVSPWATICQRTAGCPAILGLDRGAPPATHRPACLFCDASGAGEPAGG